jgi:LysM repeat protein
MHTHAIKTKTSDPPQRKPRPSVTQAPRPIMQLYSMIGNQAVLRMLNRRSAQMTGSATGEAGHGPTRSASSPAPAREKAPPIVHEVVSQPGAALDSATRGFFEPRLGHDLSNVRLHTDARAAASARAVDASAYTVGRDVVFGTAQYAPETYQGRHLLAHELMHVVQQNGRSAPPELMLGSAESPVEHEAERIAGFITGQPDHRQPSGARHVGVPQIVQRYEAGEHAQFGETGDVLKALVAERTFTYKVKPGEQLPKIAAKFGVGVNELKEANSAKLKKWRTTRGTGPKETGSTIVEGFNAGEEITIPPVINEFTQEGLKTRELIFTVNGVKLEYGQGIAMGDLYESPDEMIKAPATELQALAALIKKEKGGTPVTTAEWDAATGGRYHLLAEKNEAHFAPSNPKLVAVSAAAHGSDHKTEWEKHHKGGLDKSQAGLKDEALQINAFGDHFLTDAFAAGHLVNKRDVMERFKGGLMKNAKGEFIGDAKAFFDSVAKKSFVGGVKSEFSKYKTVASYNIHGQQDPTGWFHPSIDNWDKFSSLLQAIQTKEPDALASTVAKAVHDSLNTEPKGIPVENVKGDKWELSGDGTLNPKSKEIGRKAVGQSQLNIFDVFKVTGTIDYTTKFKKVWDYVPFPTAAGETEIKAKVASGTDPKEASLISAIVALVNTNYLVIISELVKRGYLRKA